MKRHTASTITDDDLDDLYATADRAEEAADVLRAMPPINDPIAKAHIDQALDLLNVQTRR